jgi:uncharacterized membrane protein YozB (DUF420 family)
VSARQTGLAVLGAVTSLGANATLILSLLAAVLFTIGWRLAVQKHFTAHRWVQTAAACLNAVLVFAWMIRAFVLYLIPGIPAKLGQASYAVTTAHAVVGAIGLVLGLFVVLRANELMPKALRFANYKLFMRTSYGLYMLATLMGVIVYVIVYLGNPR